MLNMIIQTMEKCISCAIEKDKGHPKILRLSIVHLYKSDLNLMTEFLWGCKLITHSESYKDLGDDQFGLRPHKACIDIVVKKMMKMTFY